MPHPPEVLKGELAKIKKKLISINNEIKKLQSKSKIEKDIGVKKDAKSSADKVRELQVDKRELQKLQEKVEKELKQAEKKSK